MSEIWILGAAGRIGAAVAARLAKAGLPLVLVGRDEGRLLALAANASDATRVVASSSLAETASALAKSRASVVVNTIGPFGESAPAIIGALPLGAHYLDLCAELDATIALLDRHDAAVAAGRTLVGGAGFGVLAAESLLLKLCAGRPPAAKARVDLIPAIESVDGVMGVAFAATVVDVLATGGRRYVDGRLVRAGLGANPERLTLPDGEIVRTGGGPSAELEVAHRVTGAPYVVAASTAAPAAPMRHLVPLIAALLRVPAMRNFATRRLAGAPTKRQPPARPLSYAHARMTWDSGEVREGWFSTGDGMAFTADVAAEVAHRLARGRVAAGAYTPGVLFGPELAEAAGGRFIL